MLMNPQNKPQELCHCWHLLLGSRRHELQNMRAQLYVKCGALSAHSSRSFLGGSMRLIMFSVVFKSCVSVINFKLFKCFSVFLTLFCVVFGWFVVDAKLSGNGGHCCRRRSYPRTPPARRSPHPCSAGSGVCPVCTFRTKSDRCIQRIEFQVERQHVCTRAVRSRFHVHMKI